MRHTEFVWGILLLSLAAMLFMRQRHFQPTERAMLLPQQAVTRGTAEDTVLVVATSVSQNAGGQPQTVRWNLRLDVSDVDGQLLISRLESLR